MKKYIDTILITVLILSFTVLAFTCVWYKEGVCSLQALHIAATCSTTGFCGFLLTFLNTK